MNCSTFQERVQQLLDGDAVALEDEFERHQRACGDCRATYAAAEELARGIRLSPWPAPPPALAPRIVARIVQEQSRQRRLLRRTWAAALAASVLVAGLALYSMALPGRKGNPDPTRVVAADLNPTAAAPSLSLDGSVAEAGSALTSLVEMTARETVKQGQLLLPISVPAPPLADMDALQQSLEPPAKSLRQAGQTLTASLEPVASSARRAFVTFQDLSPMGSEQ